MALQGQQGPTLPTVPAAHFISCTRCNALNYYYYSLKSHAQLQGMALQGQQQGQQGPTLPGVPAVLTVEDWHKQRLEVLMYRLMWVSEAVKHFQDQYSPHSGTRHYDLFIKVCVLCVFSQCVFVSMCCSVCCYLFADAFDETSTCTTSFSSFVRAATRDEENKIAHAVHPGMFVLFSSFFSKCESANALDESTCTTSCSSVHPAEEHEVVRMLFIKVYLCCSSFFECESMP